MKTSRRRFYLPIGSKGCGIGPTGRDRAMPVTWRRRTAELRRRGRTTPHPNSGQRKGNENFPSSSFHISSRRRNDRSMRIAANRLAQWIESNLPKCQLRAQCISGRGRLRARRRAAIRTRCPAGAPMTKSCWSRNRRFWRFRARPATSSRPGCIQQTIDMNSREFPAGKQSGSLRLPWGRGGQYAADGNIRRPKQSAKICVGPPFPTSAPVWRCTLHPGEERKREKGREFR